MKILILSIMFVASAAITSKVSAQVQSGPQMDFKKEVHNYGNIKNGANGTCTFEFTNTGNAPLIISKAEGTCGCTVPTWPKEPIAPGAKGTITVKYDTSKVGEINKSVKIFTNMGDEPRILNIKGNVAAPVAGGGTPTNNSGAPSSK